MPPAYRRADDVDAQRYRVARSHAADHIRRRGRSRRPRAGKHHANVAHVAAERLHNADFARAFGYGHDHCVGDADGGNEERHRANAAQSQLDAPRLLFDFLTRLLKRGSLITGTLDLRFNVGNVFDVLGVHQYLIINDLARRVGLGVPRYFGVQRFHIVDAHHNAGS